jgi:hypothetical protein
MFSSNPVSKSLLDAVNGVMSEDKGECVTKPEAKKVAKGEVEKHEKSMHKEESEQIDEAGVLDKLKSGAKKVAGAVNKVIGHPDDEGMRKDLQKKMGIPQTGRPGMAKHNEETQFTFKDRLIEREMTKGEVKKREDIVTGMKKNKEYFKKKYGARWKDVMYATATKTAMGESLELDDDQIEEQSDISTDMLQGRVQGVGQSNSFKNFKVKIEGSQKTAREPAPASAPMTAAKASISAHGGAVPSPRIGVAEELAAFVETEEFDQLEEEQKLRIIDFLQQEGWDDMLKSVKEKNKPQPSGGSGVKKGSRYGGGKQSDKDEDDKKKVTTEESEKSFPPLHVRALYNKTYAKHGGTASKAKEAQSKAYAEVEKKHGKEHRDSLEAYHKRNMSEDVEQLDELRLSTLQRYNTKAHKSAVELGVKASRAFAADDREGLAKIANKRDQRDAGIARSYRKLQSKYKKEEVEISEGKDPSMDAGAGSPPNFATDGNVTSSPVMNRIKDVTKNAMARVKTEMLGKAPGNQ